MSKGYFSADAQVLLGGGEYKNISQLKPDDFVLNMRNEAVKVTKVHRSLQAKMMELRYQNWYTPFYCTPTLQFLVTIDGTELPEMKWVAGSDLEKDMCLTSESNIYRSLLPEEFNVPLTTPKKVLMLKPNYNLGLIFGLYAGYGSISNNEIVFRFGPNDSLVDQISQLLKDLFDAETMVEKEGYCYQVRTSSTHLVELFFEFGTKITRAIPRNYWSSNEDYVRGLYHGLIEYDPDNNVSRYIPVTKQMAELFLWVCSLLGVSFENDTPRIDKRSIQVYPLFVNHEQDDSYLGKVTQVDTNANLELSSWNLEVACPTNSFIVNNLVVRSVSQSESESTSEENIVELTNEGIPQK